MITLSEPREAHMHDIMETIKTPTFLIGTVVVGLILNIFSSYLKQLIDMASGRALKRMSRMLEERDRKGALEFQRMGTDATFHRGMRARCELLQGFIGVLFCTSILLVLGGCAALISNHLADRAFDPTVDTLGKLLIFLGMAFFSIASVLYQTNQGRRAKLIIAEGGFVRRQPIARVKGMAKVVTRVERGSANAENHAIVYPPYPES
jgi:hypothetical protein